ncbi:MAG: trigger factor [Gaiellaceae bacterium]
MQTQLEELGADRVRLTVQVPREDVRHAVEHATSDLAESARVPGFRKGKVPQQVLVARLGRERIFNEAIDSHIGGWFRNAAANTRVQPVAQPDYEYDLPGSDDEEFSFTATFAVQPKPEVADWTGLEVPYVEPEIPDDLVDEAIEHLRYTAAALSPVERPAQLGDVLVIDVVGPDEAQRDYVVELGAGRLVEEIEAALVGMSAGETNQVEYVLPDESTRPVDVTVKAVNERVPAPADDELARATSEFESLDQLRADIEETLGEQLAERSETDFRSAAVDKLADASRVEVAEALVESRARELLNALAGSLERRGISADAYLALSGQNPEQLMDRLREEARRSVARELVLEAAAEKLRLEVADEEVDELVREQAEAAGDDATDVIEQLRQTGRYETLRFDLLLRNALDRIVSEVKRIPSELARARETIWTPEQDKPATPTKIWTPGTKEPV